MPVDGPFPVRLLGRHYVYHGALHDGVGRALFWADPDDHEGETLAVLTHLLRDVTPAPTVFDVGANTGFYTLATLAVTPAATVHAFEPVATITRALARNVDANGLTPQVRINQCAVTQRSGPIALHVPHESWGNARLGADGFRGLEGHVEEVAAVTLDDYAAEHDVRRLDVLKIDVEGHEDAVLGGGRRLLRELRPAILCECLPELDAGIFNRLVGELGYQPFHLRGAGPVAVDSVAPDPAGRFNNYLLLPQESAQRAWLGAAGR